MFCSLQQNLSVRLQRPVSTALRVCLMVRDCLARRRDAASQGPRRSMCAAAGCAGPAPATAPASRSSPWVDAPRACAAARRRGRPSRSRPRRWVVRHAPPPGPSAPAAVVADAARRVASRVLPACNLTFVGAVGRLSEARCARGLFDSPAAQLGRYTSHIIWCCRNLVLIPMSESANRRPRSRGEAGRPQRRSALTACGLSS